eukprot:m.129262 g.129262  ORF g.129262 m.129262 type:complete len:345 (-) comp9766_c0_seq2:150-1184(-)
MVDVASKFVGEKISRVRWCPSGYLPSGERLAATGSWDAPPAFVSLWLVPAASEPRRVACQQTAAGVTALAHADARNLLAGLANGSVSLFSFHPPTTADAMDASMEERVTWNNLHQHSFHDTCACTDIAMRPDHSMAVSCGEDGRIHTLSPSSSTPIRTFRASSGVNSVRYQTSSTVLSASNSAHLQVWDTRQTSSDPSLSCDASGDSGLTTLQSIAVHPDQPDIVATGGGDGVLSIWDLRSPRFPVALTQAHTAEVWEIQFHPLHTDHLFTCSEDGALLHWDCNPSRYPRAGGFSMSTDGTNVSITNLLGVGGLGVNSFDLDLDHLICGTDSEALITCSQLGLH